MAGHFNIFPIETRLDELFDVLYPKVNPAPGLHPSGRAFKPILESAIGGVVPGGSERRELQRNREYFKIDFQDFLDFATSDLPRQPRLTQFADQTAVCYDSFQLPGDQRPVHATWSTETGRFGLSLIDAVVARDKVFVTVIMRFAALTLAGASPDHDGNHLVGKTMDVGDGKIAECGATLIFAPETYSGDDALAGPLSEWERAMWWPAESKDPEWRFINSGEFTSYLLEQLESNSQQALFSPESIANLRQIQDANQTKYGVFFEIARLGLQLPSYVSFMYDLVVTEKKQVGTKTHRKKVGRGAQRHEAVSKPVYKFIRSIRVIRPSSAANSLATRQWVAPRYSFLVNGHWRQLMDANQMGRDPDGKPVFGRTWVRQYRKYQHEGDPQFSAEANTRDPKVVIGVKQTLACARDAIKAYEESPTRSSVVAGNDRPSDDWIAMERGKLTAGLRYLILKRDGFRCCLCGKSATDENYVKLEVDHNVPVSKWGKTVEGNLRTVCRECNRGKSDG
jgi:5-methylcytosine-specific restriction endonuclease McrA